MDDKKKYEYRLFLDDITKVNNDIIPVDDKFENFLNGIVLNTDDINYIGVYEKDTKNAFFYITENDAKLCTIIHNVWHLFHKNDDINVTIYSTYCGTYYERNDYETDIKYLYKYLITILVNKLSDSIKHD